MTLNNVFNIFYGLVQSNKFTFVIMSVLIIALIFDIALIKVNPFTTSQSLSKWRIGVFAIIVIVCVLGQYFALKFVKNKAKEIMNKKELHLNAIHRIVTIIQYGLGGILFVTIFQMIFMSRYNVAMLGLASVISYTVATVLLGLLAKQFISWFKSNRNLVVGLYGFSSAVLAISATLTLLFVTFLLLGFPKYVYPHVGFVSPTPTQSIITDFLKYPYIIASILAFILTWISTAVLLRYYSHKLGRIRYWVIVSIPLVYFLSQFLPLFETMFFASSRSDPVLFNIVYVLIIMLSKPAGGIMFGVAFWTVTKRLGHDTPIRDYMIISAYGFILLFTSDQAIVLASAPYPPFGLPTILFMGLSSYLILVGIYSSAIAVAQDAKLRQLIRKFALKESKLLDSIGVAHMQEEIQKRAITLTKQFQSSMKEETGIQPSLDEEKVKQYIDQVLKEIKK